MSLGRKHLWVYDLRTNKRFTLKERPLGHADMEEFIACARLSGRARRKEGERFKRYDYAELAARERMDLNLSWLREEGATDPASLPPPAEIAASIADDLEAALARFRAVAARLGVVPWKATRNTMNASKRRVIVGLKSCAAATFNI